MPKYSILTKLNPELFGNDKNKYISTIELIIKNKI